MKAEPQLQKILEKQETNMPEYNQEFKVELIEKEILTVELKTIDIVPGEEVKVRTIPIGFGAITITVAVTPVKEETIIETGNGFLLLFIVFKQ